jgi:Ca-activated chloride channel family protein
VGSAPAESLLREVAEKSGGACELVSPNQDVAEVIVRMFRRIRSARCSNVVVDWGQPVLWQLALPSALYGGDTLHLYARMAIKPVATPRLSWVANNTAMQSNAGQLHISTESLLPRLVAAEQITELDRSKERHSQAQLLELALRYQLVTNQTNLILVHVRAEDQKAEGLPILENIIHMQAAGWGGVGSLNTDSQTVQYSRRQPANVDLSACVSSSVAKYNSMSTPSVWRTSNRTTQPSLARFASGFDDMDDDCSFGIPAFLRKQAGDNAPSSVAGTQSHILRRTLSAVDLGPIASPLELLKAFDAVASKLLAANRFVSTLQSLHIPVEVSNLLDDFTVVLGSGAKAWAVVIQWLARDLADQFTLSRQGERLLRNCLKDESAAIVEALIQQITATMGAVQSAGWHELQVQG